MKSITASLDSIAEDLEGMGLSVLAKQVDIVSNTLEKVAKRPTQAFIFGPNHRDVLDDKGHFPIPDIAHARNALARVNQYSESPEWYKGNLKSLKEAVVRAVAHNFKSIKVTEKSKD